MKRIALLLPLFVGCSEVLGSDWGPYVVAPAPDGEVLGTAVEPDPIVDGGRFVELRESADAGSRQDAPGRATGGVAPIPERDAGRPPWTDSGAGWGGFGGSGGTSTGSGGSPPATGGASTGGAAQLPPCPTYGAACAGKACGTHLHFDCAIAGGYIEYTCQCSGCSIAVSADSRCMLIGLSTYSCATQPSPGCSSPGAGTWCCP